MKRRAFITLIGGATAAPMLWPRAARAQRREPMRRLGVLMNLAADDMEGQERVAALMQGLQERGWTVGGNLRIDFRWSAGDPEQGRTYAAELVALAPDVILASAASVLQPLQQATRTIPLLFAQVTDPVGAGVVASLARPGSNTTGFSLFEYSLSVKWLELLKEIAPRTTRVVVVRDPTQATGIGQFGAIQGATSVFGVEVGPVDLRDASDLNREVAAFMRGSNGGMITLPGPASANHRDVITAAANRYRLPAGYPFRYFVASGGLISYGPDTIDQFRPAAGYIDRILKGEKPADLPVQAPTKYETVINLNTAKSLGLDIPATVLARADEVIE